MPRMRCRPIDRSCSMSAAWRTRRTSNFWCAYSPRCARKCRTRSSSSPAKGRRASRCGSSHPRLGLAAHVYFVGYLDRDSELLDCYAAADVFVFASRTETQGLVLLEAMAQGAPLVSTARLGTRSILKEGCGALIVAEELGPFAAAAVRVLKDAPLRATLADAGRRYAREWSSLVMARRLQELYRSMSASAQARAPRRAASERALTDSPS